MKKLKKHIEIALLVLASVLLIIIISDIYLHVGSDALGLFAVMIMGSIFTLTLVREAIPDGPVEKEEIIDHL